ncbi:hypothetical protein MMC07_006402 [Pseudocyphellaria aurata]|nr:hypothetical protein [Pseudocyphellaria aurata]
MGDHTVINMPTRSVQSIDHGQLIDTINLLRSQGISRYVRLPQLIVCGDQSSGKSSVLEAISGVRFPTKDNLCTRFATELILRKDPTTSTTVSIIPGAERSEEEKEKLLNFKMPPVGVDDFPFLIDEAKKAMGLDTGTNAFSNDVLRVVISGPEQPHLTVVDLPGLIHAENKHQSAMDVHFVSSLVRSYMANIRSVILAVVSAKNDYANQIVTRLARDFDPNGLRTLGIITKPDTLHVGSDSEEAFLDLAGNKDVVFRLGWHVLKNRDIESRECSTEERDESERLFFSQGAWATLPTKVLGIATLRPRLSEVLKEQIISELPHLISDVEKGILDSQRILDALGETRKTMQEQRLYLVHVSRSFSTLVKAAVDGVYLDDFFGDAMTAAGERKRLRAVVQNIHLDFAEAIRLRGHSQTISEPDPPAKKANLPKSSLFAEKIVVKGQSQTVTEVDSTKKEGNLPKSISRAAFLDHIRELMRKSRGCELPGVFNPLIIGDLFYQQSRPWKRLLEDYSKRILNATRTTLESVLLHTADESTRERLKSQVIYPAMERYAAQLEKKVAEILRPHQKGHPITYNHYFTETIQKTRQNAKEDRLRRLNRFFGSSDASSANVRPLGFNTGDLLNAITEPNEADMDRYACSEALDCMEAYYKVAMKVIVDNFAVIGVEYCLLDRLSDIFSPETVMRFDDDLVSKIAAETEDSQNERARVIKKLKILGGGLQILNSLGPIKPAEGPSEDTLDRFDLDWEKMGVQTLNFVGRIKPAEGQSKEDFGLPDGDEAVEVDEAEAMMVEEYIPSSEIPFAPSSKKNRSVSKKPRPSKKPIQEQENSFETPPSPLPANEAEAIMVEEFIPSSEFVPERKKKSKKHIQDQEYPSEPAPDIAHPDTAPADFSDGWAFPAKVQALENKFD